MNAEIGELIAAGSTNATALTITNASSALEHQFYIEVVSGTIKFGKNSVNASAHGFTVGNKVIITCKPGELYFKAANAADTFVVTV